MEDFLIYINRGIQPSSAVSAPNTTPPASVNNNYQNVSSNVGTNLNPSTVVAVTKTVTPTIVAVTSPMTNPIVAVTNTVVSATTPVSNSMMMPQFGKTNEIYIKVTFDGIIPKTVDVVQESTGLIFEDIEKYIDGLLDGTIKSDGTPVYFKLEKTYAENIVKLIS